jgi:hypothetical protein
MFAVKGIYDGTVARPQEAVPFTGDYEVVITFLKPNPAVDPEKERRIQKKQRALDSLVGILKGNTMTLEEARDERLARQ